MTDYDKETLFAIGAMALVLALIFAGFAWVNAVRCEARWPDRETSYGVVKGCMVKTPKGWMPDDRIRETDI